MGACSGKQKQTPKTPTKESKSTLATAYKLSMAEPVIKGENQEK